jgi:Zn-dependent peptidase ImmA (M78 family)
MNAATRNERAPVNPQMLVWARRQSGFSLEEVAAKFKNIAAWEQPETDVKPTVKQARDLAGFYNRAFLEFFRTQPPVLKQPENIPDFRMIRGAPDPHDQPRLKIIQEWAEARREDALGLLAELGEQPKEIPQEFFTNIQTNPDVVADRTRNLIGFSFDEQLRIVYSNKDSLINILRQKIENFGVLVLKSNELQSHKARGMCLANFPLPVIVFGNESPGAQLFTLLHELAHIAIKQSGVIGYIDKNSERPIEKWCDQFAASFLMPIGAVTRLIGNRPNNPAQAIADEQLLTYARYFRVSSHAMLIRLVHLGYVESGYYWDIKKPQFDDDEENYKFFGRSKYWGSRYKSALGDFYTGLVLEAWNTGKITNHNAAEYMGIKNISHLFDIRDNFHR